MEFENLTPEQKEKLMATKTVEEAMAYIEVEGIDLTKEQLEAVAGGAPSISHSKPIWAK